MPLYIDIDDAGVWPLLRGLKDPELVSLVGKLPSTLIHSRADSSAKKYTAALAMEDMGNYTQHTTFPSARTPHCSLTSEYW